MKIEVTEISPVKKTLSIEASEDEVRSNPRARSAKLRAARVLASGRC